MRTLKMIGTGILVLALALEGHAAPKADDVPPLIAKLKNKDAKIRAEAAKELGYIGTVKIAFVKPAVPALIEALKDSDANVRREAAHTLGEVKPDLELAVPALSEVLKDKDNGVRIAAAGSLAEFGAKAKDALPLLMEIQKELSGLPQEEQQKLGNLIQSVNGAIRAISGK